MMIFSEAGIIKLVVNSKQRTALLLPFNCFECLMKMLFCLLIFCARYF